MKGSASRPRTEGTAARRRGRRPSGIVVFPLALLPRLARVEAIVRRGGDPEAIHDLRVATRRLREALALFREEIGGRRADTLRRTCKRLTRGLGEARNLEVAVAYFEEAAAREDAEAPEKFEAAFLVGQLTALRERAEKGVMKALDRFDTAEFTRHARAVIEERLGPRGVPLGAADAGPVRGGSNGAERSSVGAGAGAAARDGAASVRQAQLVAGGAALAARWERVAALRTSAMVDPGAEVLHRLRIAIKRYRYTLEILAPLFSGRHAAFLKQARVWQNALGRLQDLGVFLGMLGGTVAREGTAALRARIMAERRKLRREFRAGLGRLDMALHLKDLLGELGEPAAVRSGSEGPGQGAARRAHRPPAKKR